MSTTTTNDKWVIHRNGHLKRIDTTVDGTYGYKVQDGTISITAINTSVTTTSFKDNSGNVIFPDDPFVPVAYNASGFVPLYMPKAIDGVYYAYTRTSSGYESKPITGSNIITMYGLSPNVSENTMYYYNSDLSKWQAITITEGYSFLNNTGGTVTTVSFNQNNLYNILFKDKSGSALSRTSPYIPIVSNDGMLSLPIPTSYGLYGIYYDNSDGKYKTYPINGSNIINMMGIQVETEHNVMYYYNGALSRWQVTYSIPEGCFYFKNVLAEMQCISFTGENLYKDVFGCASGTDNVIIQYNKGTIYKIPVPSSAGNYNLNVDANGNVTFSQGEIAQRLASTYTLAVSGGTTPKFTGSDFIIKGDGTGNIVFNTKLSLKKAKYYVDAKFWFKVDESSIFDDTTSLTTFTFKIGSGTDNIIGKQLLYHPENGILELRFSGISATLSSSTPDFYITTTGAFADLGVSLPVADVSYVGELTLIEV